MLANFVEIYEFVHCERGAVSMCIRRFQIQTLATAFRCKGEQQIGAGLSDSMCIQAAVPNDPHCVRTAPFDGNMYREFCQNGVITKWPATHSIRSIHYTRYFYTCVHSSSEFWRDSR